MDIIKYYALIPFAYAETFDGWDPNRLKTTKLPDKSVAEILLNFISWAIIIVGLLGVIIFIYAGFMYLTAQGDTSKIEQAKRIVIYAIIGLVVSILGYVAVKTISDLMMGKNTASSSSSGGQPISPASPGDYNPSSPGQQPTVNGNPFHDPQGPGNRPSIQTPLAQPVDPYSVPTTLPSSPGQ